MDWLYSTHVDCAALAVQSPHHIASANGLAVAHFHDGADVLFKSERRNSANDSEIVLGTALHTYVHDLLEKVLDLSACLVVDGGRDALDASTTCEAADVWLGDAVDVVPQDFSVERSIYYHC